MEKFWRILTGLIICIGLPVACSYQWYQAAVHPHGADNVVWYIVSTIIVVGVIAWKVYTNSNED